MFSASAIDSLTIQAYLETEYRVHGEPGFTLRERHASADLLAAHKRQKANCSAFLTACNPFSKPFDEAANATRQAAMAKNFRPAAASSCKKSACTRNRIDAD